MRTETSWIVYRPGSIHRVYTKKKKKTGRLVPPRRCGSPPRRCRRRFSAGGRRRAGARRRPPQRRRRQDPIRRTCRPHLPGWGGRAARVCPGGWWLAAAVAARPARRRPLPSLGRRGVSRSGRAVARQVAERRTKKKKTPPARSLAPLWKVAPVRTAERRTAGRQEPNRGAPTAAVSRRSRRRRRASAAAALYAAGWGVTPPRGPPRRAVGADTLQPLKQHRPPLAVAVAPAASRGTASPPPVPPHTPSKKGKGHRSLVARRPVR